MQPYSLETHLRLAIRNAVIVLAVAFTVGVLTGWALSRWRSAETGAALGGLVGLALVTWLAWMFHATRGLLHFSGLERRE